MSCIKNATSYLIPNLTAVNPLLLQADSPERLHSAVPFSLLCPSPTMIFLNLGHCYTEKDDIFSSCCWYNTPFLCVYRRILDCIFIYNFILTTSISRSWCTNQFIRLFVCSFVRSTVITVTFSDIETDKCIKYLEQKTQPMIQKSRSREVAR